jgi:hypothetical protein
MANIPGTPWRFDENSECVMSGSGDRCIAETCLLAGETQTYRMGHLMAAAPELLAALKLAQFDLIHMAATLKVAPPCMPTVDAAIKKAEGE